MKALLAILRAWFFTFHQPSVPMTASSVLSLRVVCAVSLFCLSDVNAEPIPTDVPHAVIERGRRSDHR